MKILRTIVVLAALTLASNSPVLAQGGIDLTWNDCATGPTAAYNKNFTCTGSVNQNYSLILQFKSPVDLPQFVAFTATIALQVVTSPPGPLAPFWHYGAGGCNQTPIPGARLFDGIPASCEDACYLDPWEHGAAAFENLAAFLPDYPRPGVGRFLLLVAHAGSVPILAGRNYFGAELRFNNRNRAACAGCDQQVELVFQSALLESNDGSPGLLLTSSDQWGQCAGINNPGSSLCGIADPCPPVCPLAAGNPCDPTPVRRPSWSLLKTLYR